MLAMTKERKGMLMWRSKMVKTEVSKPSCRSGLSSVPFLDSEVISIIIAIVAVVVVLVVVVVVAVIIIILWIKEIVPQFVSIDQISYFG